MTPATWPFSPLSVREEGASCLMFGLGQETRWGRDPGPQGQRCKGLNVEVSSVISATPKKETKKVVFHVDGLHCQNCVKKVKENISFEKGVKALEVDLEKKTVTITYDPAKTNEATLRKAIEKLGYTCSL